ncbi:MAG: conjugal transfer protein TraD [Caulobacter vibrioides]|uniref:Conjugal transfer protein TraD n=1 Tax=Caulobacter vibrioides TaxID=155892 RepID=A0A258CQ67_CAUVI|nr:MAG: conjugal transfer protein TraD [Caulobacter vibrioides]
MAATNDAERRANAARHRLEAQRARLDTRAWVVKRRERTRHLIELGGLVQKAGLVDLTHDDRAALYGAFLSLATMLKADDAEHTLALWRRGGRRAFENEIGSDGVRR